MKTLDITAKEWFDKVNGNSYFSARITIDYGMESEQTICLPFQYGYDEQYIYSAHNELMKLDLVPNNTINPLWRYCKENNIILRNHKTTNCLKRDVISFGKK